MARLQLTLDYTRPDHVMKRKWSDFCKAANQDVATIWETKYAPLHYQGFSAARYGFERRALATVKKKKAMAAKGKCEGGGVLDLVQTGLMREQMARTGILTVYPTRFTLTHPTHVPRMAKNSLIDLHAEAVKVHPSEDRFLSEVWRDRILKELAAYKPRATKST